MFPYNIGIAEIIWIDFYEEKLAGSYIICYSLLNLLLLSSIIIHHTTLR